MFVIIFPTFLNVIYLDIHLRGLIFEVMKLLLENKKKIWLYDICDSSHLLLEVPCVNKDRFE